MIYTNTLELIKEDKTILAIITKAVNAGFDVLEATKDHVIVKAGCLPVEITWGMCSCHGGRMWFSQNNTNIYIELSSEKYDKDNGIVDPETELAYYIDNEMIETIKSFEKYVYAVIIIGEYIDEKIDTHYFNSIEKASKFVFEEDGHDLNNMFDEVVHQYPNPDMQKIISYVGEENGAVLFNGKHINDKKVDREYDIKFKIFRKK